jgi:hypothetical protein
MATPLHVTMNGNWLDIRASVDLDGLKKLQEISENTKAFWKWRMGFSL